MTSVQPEEILASQDAISAMAPVELGMRGVFDAISGRAVILDSDLRIVATNAAWEAAATRLGVRQSTLLANFLDVYEWRAASTAPPRSEVAAAMLDVLEGRIGQYCTDFRVEDGLEWIRLTATRAIEGGRTYLMVCQTDAAAGPEHKEELARALGHSRRLAIVVEQTESLAIITDASGHIQWVNNAFLAATNSSLDDVIGLSPGDVLDSVTDDGIGTQIAEAVQAGEPFSHLREHLIQGCPRWFQVDAQPVRKNGLVVNYVALHRDVTELVQSRATLATNEQLLTTIIDSLPVAVWWKDADRKLLGCNQALRTQFAEHGVGDWIGRRFSDEVFGPVLDCLVEIESLEAEVLATGIPLYNHRMVLPHETGDRNCLHSVIPLASANGFSGVVSTQTDVSHSHAMEQALAEANRLESIGQLAAGVAHEINTPIQYVSDNTTFLAESFTELTDAFDVLTGIARTADAESVDTFLATADIDFLRDEIPGALDQARDGLGRVTEIVRAMKDFSHPGSELSETDLNKAITSTVTVSRSEWKFVADTRLELADDLPAVTCHEGQIKQVVLNLIVNAAHAIADVGGADKGTITITTEAAAHGAVISISDTGCGMPSEVKQRIFEQFFTTKEVGRGTGQGLAMAHTTVVHGHGGHIEVDSVPGEGTTFVITLPYEQQDGTT